MSVVVVGVAGCSASGKTRAASRLAALLRSPIAPIGMDSFFDPDTCAALGTWEDPRCLRSADFAAALVAVRQQLACSKGSEARDGDGACGADCAKTENDDKEFSDDSLTAHAAEDARHRAVSSALAAEHSASPGPVQFVVCEGFLLFADPAVCAVVDYFVFIDVDGETACLRRFLRAPRRHSRTQSWNARIEKMLQQRPLPPPLPSTQGDYEGFWRRAEYVCRDTEERETNGDDDMAWMALADPARVARVLRESSDNAEEAVSVPQPYYEFRYWFYYEVLYQYRRHRQVMEENVADATAAEKPRRSHAVWHIANGAEISPEALERCLRCFAECIRKECDDFRG